jgi:hypothetical protein
MESRYRGLNRAIDSEIQMSNIFALD